VKYTALVLAVALVGVLLLSASLFDRATLIMVVIALAVVGIFGTLPVFLGVVSRRSGGHGTPPAGPETDDEVVRFDPDDE